MAASKMGATGVAGQGRERDESDLGELLDEEEQEDEGRTTLF